MTVMGALKKRGADYQRGHEDGVKDGVQTAVRLLLTQFGIYLGDKRGWKRERIFDAILWIHKHATMIIEGYTTFEEEAADLAADYGIVYEDGNFSLLTDAEMERRKR